MKKGQCAKVAPIQGTRFVFLLTCGLVFFSAGRELGLQLRDVYAFGIAGKR